MDDEREMGRGVARRKTASNLTFCVKKGNDGKYRKVYAALQKKDSDLTEEERQLVLDNADLVKKARESLKKREEVKARSEEVEDPDDVLIPKCTELAAALRNSNHLVVYTGAGISTAAKIPDYRGSNGIWTLLQKGKDIGKHDLSRAEPTLTHMALFELYTKGILKYIVSQNCDGLHLRSGLPRSALSEVHGNMHLEVCPMCRPTTQYWRMFDVTENTGRFSHRTMRRCHLCHSALIDTIVHFGERGNLPWPLNWPAASKAADNADTILCIGSSLKVLKKYPWLWGMDKPARKRPKLYIINLQWTPKDDQAVLKINGRCDRVMEEVMKCLSLQVPEYSRFRDPIFCHATHLHPDEMHTTSQPELDCPFKKEDKELLAEITTSKQAFKRVNDSNDDGNPMKVRKFEHEYDTAFVVKLELQGSTSQNETSLITELQGKVTEDARIQSGDIGDKNLNEFYVMGRCKEKDVKQEPLDSEELITTNQTPLLISVEEIVGQTNTSIDIKKARDNHVDLKENDVRTPAFGCEKKEEDVKQTSFLSGQNITSNSIPESIICSKVHVENTTSNLQSVDGKENVAFCFLKVGSVESLKSSKKLDPEKVSDVNDSEKSPKLSVLMNNGAQSTRVEPLFDCFGSLKSQKSIKNSCDVAEDEVVVLKMLQLEHNYSKTVDDCCDKKSTDLKESAEVRKDSKNSKIDSKTNLKETVKRNLRRTSRDAVNYLEVDEEEVEDEEDEEEEDGTDVTQKSVRTSRRVQEKQTAKQQAKQPSKSQNKLESRKNEGERKPPVTETKNISSKNNKPTTPLKNKKLTKADFEMGSELKTRACNFCLNFYQSKNCMFYPSLDFRPRQYEGCICECCDYSSESEEVDEECSNGEGNDGKGDSTDNADEASSKSSMVNPGWYGKGYRKRFRKRK